MKRTPFQWLLFEFLILSRANGLHQEINEPSHILNNPSS